MTTPITPVASWDAIVGPSDTEAGTAASVNNALQALANRSHLIRAILNDRFQVYSPIVISAGDGETNSVLRSFTSTSFVKATELDVTLFNLQPFDILCAIYSLNIDKTGTNGFASLKLTKTESGGETDFAGSLDYFPATSAYQGRLLFGAATLSTGGNYTVDVQGRVQNGADALRINSSAVGLVFALRSGQIP